MKILVVYPYIPFPTDRGTYQRTYHLLRALAAEHEVDLLALSEAGERLEQLAHFSHFCSRVEFVSFEHPQWPSLLHGRLLSTLPTTIQHWRQDHIATAIKGMLTTADYDLVHVCDIVMAQYFLEEHRDIPLSIDRSRVDLQFQLAQQEAMGTGTLKEFFLHNEQIIKLRRFERRVADRCQLQIVCGPDDKSYIRQNISRHVPVKVIANGVDLDYFDPTIVDTAEAAEPTLLFCGAMDYTPNIDALRWYFGGGIHASLLQQIPNLKLLIVGKSPTPEVLAYSSQPGVTVTGGVPDVRPYYRKAWAQIVPLRIGGGTRLKIPESMAMETPVISTTIGAQGLNLFHAHDILLADSESEFARQTMRLLTQPILRTHLTRQGVLTCRQRLSWRHMGRDLCHTYAQTFPSLSSPIPFSPYAHAQ